MNDEQDFSMLVSVEQQLLTAAGAARLAARRISDRRDMAEMRGDILRVACVLEGAAHRAQEQRRALLTEWSRRAERSTAQVVQGQRSAGP